MAENQGNGSKILGTIKDGISLKWVRSILFNVGGRKLALGGGALAIIDRIVQTAGASFGWAHAVACLGVGFASVGVAWAIASEDKGKQGSVPAEPNK